MMSVAVHHNFNAAAGAIQGAPASQDFPLSPRGITALAGYLR